MKTAMDLIEAEYPLTLRAVVPGICKRAYGVVDALAKENLLLQSPGVQLGHLRAWAVEFALQQAIDAGEFRVAGYEWVAYEKNTGHFLRVHTEGAVLTTSQLVDPMRRPRRASHRQNASFNNQQCLPGFEPEQAAGNPHLILIHGYQNLNFIHFAMPNPDEADVPWLGMSRNLLSEMYLVTNELAPVEAQNVEAVLSIKDALKGKVSNDG